MIPQIDRTRILTEEQIANLSDGSFRLYRASVKTLKRTCARFRSEPLVTGDEKLLAEIRAITYAWAAVQREYRFRNGMEPLPRTAR